MKWFWDLNLIHCLDFYLVLIFVTATVLRVLQYRALLGMVWSMHDRWPNLVKMAKKHRGLFLTWGTVLPALLALLLSLGHMLACRLVWPNVHVTIAQLVQWWLAVLVVGLLGIAMVGVDGYGALQGEDWDRTQAEKQLDQGLGQKCLFQVQTGNWGFPEDFVDAWNVYFLPSPQAEHWLASWTAPAIRVFTLGFVNPRRLVGVEVHKALVDATRQLNTGLWWSSLPISLRIAFGGSLWLTYVCGPS